MKIILWVSEGVHKTVESNMKTQSEILEKLYIVKRKHIHPPKISQCSLSLTLAVR